MESMEFSVQINAPAKKVWEKLWSDAGYRAWTAAFSEGSHAESDWEEGSKIRFLSPKGGMFGLIREKKPNEKMVFEHRGEIVDGVETEKEWAGALEQYFLQENNGTTTLKVQLDAMDAWKEYFSTTFPKALAKVKELAEGD